MAEIETRQKTEGEENHEGFNRLLCVCIYMDALLDWIWLNVLEIPLAGGLNSFHHNFTTIKRCKMVTVFSQNNKKN